MPLFFEFLAIRQARRTNGGILLGPFWNIFRRSRAALSTKPPVFHSEADRIVANLLPPPAPVLLSRRFPVAGVERRMQLCRVLIKPTSERCAHYIGSSKKQQLTHLSKGTATGGWGGFRSELAMKSKIARYLSKTCATALAPSWPFSTCRR